MMLWKRVVAARRLIMTGGVYLLSVGLLFFGEMAYAKAVDPEDLARYQLIRNAAPLAVIMGLIGLDQALVRWIAMGDGKIPRFSSLVWKRVISSSLWAGFLAGIMTLSGSNRLSNIAILIPLSMAMAFLYMASASAKGGNLPIISAWWLQGYRGVAGLLLLCGVSLGLVLPSGWGIWTLTGGAFIFTLCALLWWKSIGHSEPPDVEAQRRLNKLGIGFMIPMVATTTTDWLDQQLVVWLLSLNFAGQYGLAKLVIIFPIMSLASILGFVALPWAVKNTKILHGRRLFKIFYSAGISSLLLSITFGICGSYVARYFYEVKLSIEVLVCLIIAASARLYYVVPSSIVGAQGSPKALVRVGIWSFVGTAMMVVFAVLLHYLNPHDNSFLGVALGLAIANIFRACSSTYEAINFFRYRKVELY